jgi:hypothetical protein
VYAKEALQPSIHPGMHFALPVVISYKFPFSLSTRHSTRVSEGRQKVDLVNEMGWKNNFLFVCILRCMFLLETKEDLIFEIAI